MYFAPSCRGHEFRQGSPLRWTYDYTLHFLVPPLALHSRNENLEKSYMFSILTSKKHCASLLLSSMEMSISRHLPSHLQFRLILRGEWGPFVSKFYIGLETLTFPSASVLSFVYEMPYQHVKQDDRQNHLDCHPEEDIGFILKELVRLMASKNSWGLEKRRRSSIDLNVSSGYWCEACRISAIYCFSTFLRVCATREYT